LREFRFRLAWTEHGGSGLSLPFSDFDELGVDEIIWYLNRQNDQRRSEAAAIKRANKGRR